MGPEECSLNQYLLCRSILATLLVKPIRWLLISMIYDESFDKRFQAALENVDNIRIHFKY